MTPLEKAKARYIKRAIATRRRRRKFLELWPPVRQFAPFTVRTIASDGVEFPYCVGVTDERHERWGIPIGSPSGPNICFAADPPPPPPHALKLCRYFVMWHQHWFFGQAHLDKLRQDVETKAVHAVLLDCENEIAEYEKTNGA